MRFPRIVRTGDQPVPALTLELTPEQPVLACAEPGHQAKHSGEMQVVADVLSLLANIVMAWNTAQRQKVLDH
jgi:hypothetical protein